MHQRNSVRVAQLVGREPAPDRCFSREVAKLDTRVGPSITQRSGPDRKLEALSEPRLDR